MQWSGSIIFKRSTANNATCLKGVCAALRRAADLWAGGLRADLSATRDAMPSLRSTMAVSLIRDVEASFHVFHLPSPHTVVFFNFAGFGTHVNEFKEQTFIWPAVHPPLQPVLLVGDGKCSITEGKLLKTVVYFEVTLTHQAQGQACATNAYTRCSTRSKWWKMEFKWMWEVASGS